MVAVLKLQLANRDAHVRFVLTKAQRTFAYLVFRERKRRKRGEGKAGGGRTLTFVLVGQNPKPPKFGQKSTKIIKLKKKQERHETQLAEITVIGHLFFKTGLFYVRNVGVM